MNRLNVDILTNVLGLDVKDFYIRDEDTVTIWTTDGNIKFVCKHKIINDAKDWLYNVIDSTSLFIMTGKCEKYECVLTFLPPIGGFEKTFLSDESEADAVLQACQWFIDEYIKTKRL